MYGLLYLTIFIIFIYIYRKKYMQSLYYAETNNSFIKALLNTGVHGEYLTFKKLEKVSAIKKYLPMYTYLQAKVQPK